ncbi:hypothetical protein [Vibrio paucivorans]
MKFNISRINTPIGIFRLSGDISESEQPPTLTYNDAEFMGTDGWVLINTASEHGSSILTQIEPYVLEHLADQ